MSSKPITAKSVEQFLLAKARTFSLSDLMYAFVGDESRHEQRLKDVIEKLKRKNAVVQITAKTSAPGIIGVDLCERFGIPLTEPRYFHVLNGHEIIKLLESKALEKENA